MGCDVTLIDYRCPKIEKREAVPTWRNVKTVKDVIKYLLWHRKLQAKHDGFWKFIDDNIRITNSYDHTNIGDLNNRFDSFVVGSDIVWGSEITGHDKTFFLNFSDCEKKKYSFSSSIGTLWDESEREEIATYLKRFNKISVREELAMEWIKQYVGIDVNVTCDPTMLFDANYWENMCDDYLVPKEKYVLIYLENPDKKNVTDGIQYAKKHGLSAYFINFYRHVKGTKSITPETVQQWLSLVKHADTVFSASYHGLLFSLYFHRNVFYYNRGEKSRMVSLGKALNIEHREGTDTNVMNDIPVDYTMVDKIISHKREESWEYLRNISKEL
ncbi:MAG: polysaccharide pyruvyl transferase family protein [Oscillospiraceae bacterium]|nr:polysaccharide pyruvyl transferase family protein [Oscillospiraceae bacterium]